MDKISLALSALLGIVMVIWITPGILAMNRGKILRNIALWLGIFLATALVYHQFGPGRAALTTDGQAPAFQQGAQPDQDEGDSPAADNNSDSDSNAYTPPQD